MSTVIKVENLSKQYRLGMVGTGTLGHDLNRWWHTVRGKEDPYLKIGEVNDRTEAGTSEYVWALRNINFKVEEGEVLGIIGRNGAGKSTLLKILSRTTTPTTGSIKIKGRVASLLEVGTGFHPELSGRENIFLNGAILGMTKSEIRSKFDEIVDFAGVERYIDTPVKRYSSGMYVRLAFGVAAHLEPEILIVDEVLAVGDTEFQKKALGKMKDVSTKDGRTVLFVSHQMGVISQLCQNALILNNGGVLNQGNAQEMVAVYSQNSQKDENIYEISEEPKKAANYIQHISTVNDELSSSGDFLFEKKVRILIRFVINDLVPNLQIGIGLNDKLQSRVFTVLRAVNEFKKSGNTYSGVLELPEGLIAPNYYNVTVALWTKEGTIHDHVENVCNFKIHDDGTILSLYEGNNYGSVIIHPQWLEI